MDTETLQRRPWRLRLALALVWITPGFWAVNYFVARRAAGEIEPHMLALLRWAMVGLVLLLLARAELRRHWPLTRSEQKDAVVMGALGMWICGAFVYIGGQTTSALNIGLLYALAPVLISVISVKALGESFSALQIVGLLLALCGMVWIVTQGNPGQVTVETFRVGDLWILAAVVSWTIYSLRLKAVPSRFSPLGRLCVMTMGGLLVLIPTTALEAVLILNGLGAEGGAATPGAQGYAFTPYGLWLAVLVAVFPGLLAYGSYSFMQRELGAARASLAMYLGPLYTGLMGWAFLNEPPFMYHLVGGAAILLGIYWATARRTS